MSDIKTVYAAAWVALVLAALAACVLQRRGEGRGTRTATRAAWVLMVLAAAVIGLMNTPFGFLFFSNPGLFHRSRFEAVVARVRDMPLEVGETKLLRLDDLSDPASLRPCEPDEFFRRGECEGVVWARLDADGRLAVVIQTRDLGHAGSFGYAYSDAQLTPTSDDPSWSWIAVPGPLNLVRAGGKMDDHWWKVTGMD